jgi:hypothetical protein
MPYCNFLASLIVSAPPRLYTSGIIHSAHFLADIVALHEYRPDHGL